MRQNGVAAGSYTNRIAPKLLSVFSYAPLVGIFMWKRVQKSIKLWVSGVLTVDKLPKWWITLCGAWQ